MSNPVGSFGLIFTEDFDLNDQKMVFKISCLNFNLAFWNLISVELHPKLLLLKNVFQQAWWLFKEIDLKIDCEFHNFRQEIQLKGRFNGERWWIVCAGWHLLGTLY